MSLTERSRSALYQGLSSIVDEEAVEEMLSYFPARDVDEPVTANKLHAEMADMRTELHVEMASLKGEFRDEIAALRTEVAEFRTDIKADMVALELRMNDRLDAKFTSLFTLTIGANVATVLTIALVIFAAIRL